MNLSHMLDLIEHLTGLEAESCSAFANAVDGHSEVEDTISLSIGYVQRRGRLCVRQLGAAREPSLEDGAAPVGGGTGT